MLIYVLRCRPSWISDRHKKPKHCRGPSNEHSCTVWLCSDVKFKMAATAGLSLILDPMGKMFQNASSLKPLGQLKPKLPRNDHWKVLYQVTVFYADQKSKMAATAGHRLTLDPMGKCFKTLLL